MTGGLAVTFGLAGALRAVLRALTAVLRSVLAGAFAGAVSPLAFPFAFAVFAPFAFPFFYLPLDLPPPIAALASRSPTAWSRVMLSGVMSDGSVALTPSWLA
jgi:hypothetical protein